MGNRTRAQPEHRLDRFTQWSRDIIANNKRKSGTGSEILSASQYYTTPINETAQKLGKSIKAIQDQLYERDNIHYGTIENGTGSKKHRFYYGYNPFEEA